MAEGLGVAVGMGVAEGLGVEDGVTVGISAETAATGDDVGVWAKVGSGVNVAVGESIGSGISAGVGKLTGNDVAVVSGVKASVTVLTGTTGAAAEILTSSGAAAIIESELGLNTHPAVSTPRVNESNAARLCTDLIKPKDSCTMSPISTNVSIDIEVTIIVCHDL